MFTISSDDTAGSLFETTTPTTLTRGRGGGGGGGSGAENDSCIGPCGVDGTDGEIIIVLIAGVGGGGGEAMTWGGG